MTVIGDVPTLAGDNFEELLKNKASNREWTRF